MWKNLLLICVSINAIISGRELLPPFPDTLQVEPSLPASFIMGPNPDLYSGVIWGEQKAIEDLLHSHHINAVFFFVQLCGDVIQRDPTGFLDEFQLPQRFDLMGCKNVEIRKTFWQKHPVLIAQYRDHEGRNSYRLWIGLNSRIGGWVLSVSFQYPEKQKAPTSDQLAIWNQFLHTTDS